MLKLVVVAEKNKTESDFIKEIERAFAGGAKVSVVIPSRNLMGDIRKEVPDVLITLDLAGFEHATLTDNVGYNLLDCKQIHFLTQTGLQNEKYLEKMLSIAMFFYCSSQKHKEYLLQNYPDIPWLDVWEEKEEIRAAIDKVLKECRLI